MKEELPNQVKEALCPDGKLNVDSHEQQIVDDIGDQISDFKKLMDFSSKHFVVSSDKVLLRLSPPDIPKSQRKSRKPRNTQRPNDVGARESQRADFYHAIRMETRTSACARAGKRKRGAPART